MSEIFIIENENLLNSSQIESLNTDKHIVKVSINNLQKQINYNYFYIDDIKLINEILKSRNKYMDYNFIICFEELKKSAYQNHQNVRNINIFLTEMCYDTIEITNSQDIIRKICFCINSVDDSTRIYILSESLNVEGLQQQKNSIKHFNIDPYIIDYDETMFKNKKISICFCHYNRTFVDIGNGCIRPIFLNSLQSVMDTIDGCEHDNILFEICILDYSNKDNILVKEWADEFLKGYDYQLKTMKLKEVEFSDKTMMDRGLSRNIVGNMATGDYILWLDTDMIIDRKLIMEGLKTVYKNHIFFPVCFYYLTVDNQYGFWANGGYGNVMMSRKIFKRNKWPQYPEHTLSYEEDSDFFKKLQKKYKTIELCIDDYFHQYHLGKMADNVPLRAYKCNDGCQIDLNKTVDIKKFLKEYKI